MKIGPLVITRARPADPDPDPGTVSAAQRPARERGASGTSNLGGFLDGFEYHPQLRGRQALDTWARMRSDGSVEEAEGHIRAPILNANIQIEPAGDTEEDLVAAAAVEKAYRDWLAPGWGWQQHLDEALDYLTNGHYLFERVEHVVVDVLEIDDPQGALEPDPTDPTGQRQRRQKKIIPAREYLTFRRFDPRLPETITRWNEQDGELASVTQQAFKDGDYGEWTIPVEQLLLLTHRRRGHDYTGRSILRAAYKHWVMKELIEKVAAIAVERHGVGTWIAYPPKSAANDQAVLDRLELILQNIRSGANSYVVAPGPKQQTGAIDAGEGYLFEVLSPGGEIPDFTRLLEYKRGEIKGSMLVRFSELGHGRTGARATSDTQSEIWYAALHAAAQQVAEVHQEQIKWFVRSNLGMQRYPRLVFTDIESRNLAEYAEGIARLLISGGMRPDKPLRDWVRRTVDAPEEAEGDPANQDEPPGGDEPDDGVEEDETT